MITGKVWGKTKTLLATPFVEMHRVSIAPHSRCSMHLHEHKHNAFLVISGSLTIEVEKNDYELTDKTELGPGDFTVVKPGEFHQFISGSDPVDAIEVYYPEPLSEDIERRDCGESEMHLNGLEPPCA